MTRALLVAGLLTLAFAGQAHALPSDVKLGCLSGSTGTGPPPPAGVGTGACTLSPTATANGSTSGMGALFRPVISPDGRNLYAITGAHLFSSTTVATFNRNAATGALTFAGCISGDTAQTACTPIPSATAGAAGSGMAGLSDLAIAPDGKNVYAVAGTDDAITSFARTTTTGALTFLDCDTGNATVASATCLGVPSAAAGGTDSGMDQLNRLAVSPVNDFVAATSFSDDAGVSFKRDPTGGSLAIEGCVTGEISSGPTGSNACAPLLGNRISADGAGTGFDQLGAVTYSPDGLNLYVASVGDDTVTTLARPDTGPATGFTFAQCMSGSFAMGPTATGGNNRCNVTNNPTANGTNSDLDGPTTIVVPNDGLDVLVASQGSDAVATFGRGQPLATPIGTPVGTLGFTGCLTSLVAIPTTTCARTPVTGNFSGLHSPGDLTVAPDNTTVLVSVSGAFTTSANALTTLTRNVTFGGITFNRCIAADTAAGPGGSGACTLLPSATPGSGNSGQASPGGVVVSPDNRHVYVAGFFDAAITWYGNDADGDTVGDSIDNCPAAANTNQSDLDGDGIGDVCDPTPTGPPGPTPPGPPPPATGGATATTTTPTATTPTPAASGATPPPSSKPGAGVLSFPAQMKVRSAALALRGGRRTLRIDATVSTRANGQRVTISYRSSGVTTRRTVTVVRGRIRTAVRLPATQPLNTGVVTLSLGATTGLRAQQVTVRAADRPAALKTKEARILNKKLRVSGTISPLATGAVLIRIDYSDKQGNPLTATSRARIFNGKWKTLQGLEPDARDGGVVTILYPGLARSPLGPIRGEQDARVIGVGR